MHMPGLIYYMGPGAIRSDAVINTIGELNEKEG